MNKNKALLAGAAMVALSMPLAQKEAKAASALMSASAIVVDALAIAAVNDLHFGTFSLTAAGNCVAVNTTGSRSQCAGTPTLIPGGALEQQGTMSVSGAAGIDINWSIAAFPIALNNGANVLNITQITLGGDLTTPVTLNSGSLNGTARLTAAFTTGAPGTINVGGQVVAPLGTEPGGTYTGSFTVVANYN
jgi:hypothetical protein